MSEEHERFDYCPTHTFIQDERTRRYQDIEARLGKIENRLDNSVTQLLFWCIIGFVAGVIGWIFVRQVIIADRIADVRETYATHADVNQFRTEFYNYSVAWQEHFIKQLDKKEDAHARGMERYHE